MNELNIKQQKFAELYAHTGNGKQAAMSAGYSPRTASQQASQLLAKPHVSAEIDRLASDTREAGRVEMDEVVSGLRAVAFAPASAKVSNADRLRALELLGRTIAAFSDRNITQFEEPPVVFDDIDATIAECKAAKDAISRNIKFERAVE